MGDCLTTVDMGRKLGTSPFSGVAASPCNNVAWTAAYLRTKWHLDPSSRLARTNMGRNSGEGAVPPFGGEGGGSPSCTMWPGLRPASIPSGILIHGSVWSQQTWADN